MTYRDADVWQPTPDFIENSNLSVLIKRLGLPDYDAFLRLSIEEPEKYWAATLAHLNITFDPAPTSFVDLSKGKPWPQFFPGGGFNFASACLEPPPGPAGINEIAVIWESESGESHALTYGELATRTKNFASGLLKIGVKHGDRIGILFPNTPEAIMSFLAISYIGAIVIPLYSGYGADAVARRLIDSQATCLITGDGFHRRGKYISLKSVATSALATIEEPIKLIVAGEIGAVSAEPSYRSWQDIEKLGAGGTEPAKTQANTPYMVIYTSGTTGKPKGAVHNHAGFPLRVAQDVAFLFDFKRGDRFFWPSDMGWMVGPFSICSALLLKGALVIYDGAPDYPDIGRLRAVSARHGVTHFGSTPTAIRSMSAAENASLRDDAPTLRVLMSGGEVMDEDAFSWFFQRFGGGKLPIINYSGGTEVSGALLTNVVLRPIAPCCFNSTAPGVKVRVVDATGTPIFQTVGELAIFEPFIGMTAGFWNDEARYIDTYWSRFQDVWVHGDLALEEANGQFLLLGRSDDVMKISGKRVGPSEIEGIVADGFLVSEVLVFSVPNAKSGESMIVFIVPGPGGVDVSQDSIESTISNRLREKMGPSYKPHAVVTLVELVKTKNGKLVRRLARQAWLNEIPGDLSAIENPTVFDEIAIQCVQYREAKQETQN